MTATQQAGSRVLLDIDEAACQALAVEPALVLEGARPRLLDEGQVEQAAVNLKRFAEQIDGERSGTPAFLAVICGKGYGYRRSDGVLVVPIGVLGP